MMEKNKKRSGMLVMVTVAIFISLAIAPTIPAHSGTPPEGLEIIDLVMSDYTLKCKLFGGDDVGVTVVVKNVGDETYTDSFNVGIWVSTNIYVNDSNIDQDLDPNETIMVRFFNHLDLSISGYTMDAYIDNAYETHDYCDFDVTLFGL